MKSFKKYLGEKLKASDDMGDWVKDMHATMAGEYKDDEEEMNESRNLKQPGPHPDLVKAKIKHDHHQSPFKKSKTWVTVDKKDYEKAKKILGNKLAANGGSVYLAIEEAVKSGSMSKNEAMKKPSDKELHKTLAMTKNMEQGIAALMKKHGMDKGTARAHIKRLMSKESIDLGEAKTDIYHKHMLKALGKSRLPKNHSYTSAIANNGDFVVKDGGGRTVGRIPKGEHNLKD